MEHGREAANEAARLDCSALMIVFPRAGRSEPKGSQCANTVGAENYYQHPEHLFRSMSSDQGPSRRSVHADVDGPLRDDAIERRDHPLIRLLLGEDLDQALLSRNVGSGNADRGVLGLETEARVDASIDPSGRAEAAACPGTTTRPSSRRRAACLAKCP